MKKGLLVNLAAAMLAISWASAVATEFHVSPVGNDSSPGTKAAPLATLTKARDAIRAIKRKTGLPKGGVTVFLHGARHVLKETFVLRADTESVLPLDPGPERTLFLRLCGVVGKMMVEDVRGVVPEPP